MRVVRQLAEHLQFFGRLTADQLDELRKMGLLSPGDLDTDFVDTDFEDPAVPAGPFGSTDEDEDDALDARGDAMIAEATRQARKQRARSRKPPLTSRVTNALAQNLTHQSRHRPLLVEVARRLDARVDAEDAAAVVAAASIDELVDATTRDDLWARCWPFLEDDVFSGLPPTAQRYLHRLLGRGHAPEQLEGHPAIRRSLELTKAHRQLTLAFDQTWRAMDPVRVHAQLDMAANPLIYEAMVILYGARAPRRTIADLPSLPHAVGIPLPASLPSVPFEAGWQLAARFDPVAVLAYMEFCVAGWDAPDQPYVKRQEFRVGNVSLAGGWTNVPVKGFDGWYGLNLVDGRWVRTWCSAHDDDTPRGTVSQRFTHDRLHYVHTCSATNCHRLGRLFTRPDGSGRIGVSWWDARYYYDRPPPGPAAFGERWERGFVDSPLLTCPTEWGYP